MLCPSIYSPRFDAALLVLLALGFNFLLLRFIVAVIARTMTSRIRRTTVPPAALPTASPTGKGWGSDEEVLLVAVVVEEAVESTVEIEFVMSLLLTVVVGGDSVVGCSVTGSAAGGRKSVIA